MPSSRKRNRESSNCVDGQKKSRGLVESVRQRALEIKLERVPAAPRPGPDLEQYRTPPKIAADVLYRALALGDIQGRAVVDLGCGTGMFLVGAGLLGASRLAGVDADPGSIETARRVLADFELDAELATGDVATLAGRFDTAVMNPPFGAQKAQRHADTIFVQHALRLAPVAYSLHLQKTEAHLVRLARSLGADFDRLAEYDFPLRAQFEFHTRERVDVEVALYRFRHP